MLSQSNGANSGEQMLKVDPGRLQSFDWDHCDAVEEFIGNILVDHLGFGRKPIVTRTYGNAPEYDLLFDFGGTEVLRAELKVTRDRWLPVEFASNGKGTGLSGTTADIWVYVSTGGTTFDNRGVDVGDGFKVEGKINIIKPDTLLQFIVDNSDDQSKVKYANYQGVEVAYINTHALNNRHWFGACEIIPRSSTELEMDPNQSKVKSFDLGTFTRTKAFSIERVLHAYVKLSSDEMTNKARSNSDRLVNIVGKSSED